MTVDRRFVVVNSYLHLNHNLSYYAQFRCAIYFAKRISSSYLHILKGIQLFESGNSNKINVQQPSLFLFSCFTIRNVNEPFINHSILLLLLKFTQDISLENPSPIKVRTSVDYTQKIIRSKNPSAELHLWPAADLCRIMSWKVKPYGTCKKKKS